MKSDLSWWNITVDSIFHLFESAWRVIFSVHYSNNNFFIIEIILRIRSERKSDQSSTWWRWVCLKVNNRLFRKKMRIMKRIAVAVNGPQRRGLRSVVCAPTLTFFACFLVFAFARRTCFHPLFSFADGPAVGRRADDGRRRRRPVGE